MWAMFVTHGSVVAAAWGGDEDTRFGQLGIVTRTSGGSSRRQPLVGVSTDEVSGAHRVRADG